METRSTAMYKSCIERAGSDLERKSGKIKYKLQRERSDKQKEDGTEGGG